MNTRIPSDRPPLRLMHDLYESISREHNLRSAWRRRCPICRHYFALWDALLAEKETKKRKARR